MFALRFARLAGTNAAYTPGPWDLTLDTLIALLGAVVTITLTVLALLQTKRANQLQEEARIAEKTLEERQRRFRLYQAMLPFLDTIERDDDPGEDFDAAQMTAMENGFGHDSPELEWIAREGNALANSYRSVTRDAAGQPVDQSSYYAYLRVRQELRRRLAHWVDSGDFPKDRSWTTTVSTPTVT